MLQLMRYWKSGDYRFGFNSMEKDDKIKGVGNSPDFGARMYDSRLGRWISRDPAESKYAFLSPYVSFANNPVLFVDPDGKRVLAYADSQRPNDAGIYGEQLLNAMQLLTDDQLKLKGNEVVINKLAAPSDIQKPFGTKLIRALLRQEVFVRVQESRTNYMGKIVTTFRTEISFPTDYEKIKKGEIINDVTITWNTKISNLSNISHDDGSRITSPQTGFAHEGFHALDAFGIDIFQDEKSGKSMLGPLFDPRGKSLLFQDNGQLFKDMDYHRKLIKLFEQKTRIRERIINEEQGESKRSIDKKKLNSK